MSDEENPDSGDRKPWMCRGTNKTTGKPCRLARLRGSTVCAKHGAATTSSKAAAARRLALAEAKLYADNVVVEKRKRGRAPIGRASITKEADRMLQDSGADKSPTQHLLESLWRASALCEVWGKMAADLDAESKGTRGQITYEYDKETGNLLKHHNDGLLVLSRDGMAKMHPFVQEYHQALERRARFAKLAIEAGLEERQVRVMEHQVEIAYRALEVMFDRMEFDQQQRAQARNAFVEGLRAV